MKLTSSQLVKKYPAFYGTRRFIAELTSARQLSLSWASSIQSTPTTSHFLKIHLNIILPSTPGSPKWPLSLTFLYQYTVYALLSPIRATCPAHLNLLDIITRTILSEEYRSWSFSLCSFLQSLVTSSILGPNILLNTLFSNTLSLCSSLSDSDQVSHPYRTTGKIIVLYTLTFTFWIANWKTKDWTAVYVFTFSRSCYFTR